MAGCACSWCGCSCGCGGCTAEQLYDTRKRMRPRPSSPWSPSSGCGAAEPGGDRSITIDREAGGGLERALHVGLAGLTVMGCSSSFRPCCTSCADAFYSASDEDRPLLFPQKTGLVLGCACSRSPSPPPARQPTCRRPTPADPQDAGPGISQSFAFARPSWGSRSTSVPVLFAGWIEWPTTLPRSLQHDDCCCFDAPVLQERQLRPWIARRMRASSP